MIQVSGINHIVLHVQDVARAKKFYTELLGMTVYRENSEQAFMHCGNQGVALFAKRDGTPLTTGNDLNHLALDITAGTYDAIKAELEKHGVEVSGRPGDPHCIYFHDLDGHRLQLMVHD
jgi:catechol 2,3-dioxygenase-like lactoylglutathione lyase family enzyme